MKLTISLVALAVLVTAFSFGGRRLDPVNSCVVVYNQDGCGSGAIVDANCVLTAQHVAEQPDLMIRTPDGDEHKVVRVAKDPNSDLALLYIDGVFDETPLRLDPTPLKVGERVTLIGTYGTPDMAGCVLTGKVVKVDTKRDYNYSIPAVNVDVLDCHCRPGCSGGPVLDRRGVIRSVLILGDGILCGAVPVEELNL